MHDLPLAAADFAFLDATLQKYGNDYSVLNASELDGYVSALVSSPAQVDISQWFPAIWGGQMPEWQNAADCQRFVELSARHLNSLATQLVEAPQTFAPRLEQTEHQGQPLPLAEEWCFGYLRGFSIANWPALPEAQANALQVIAELAGRDEFELPVDLDVALHRQRVQAIAPAARALHDYWLAQR
ncbi:MULTISPECIES: UPF0149 family protein [Pseudomonas]|uniref:YecA family protein n=1 Tax=Pseudomonas fluorescens TaxID=294 RepID=A0A5E6T4P2_PSEFL|nr:MULTISPECIES: UPF0149 family protein [Pseudomonas]VVM87397.1 hypothetical protein PS652_02602 [Pseudomonas fluorescens]